MLGVLHKQCGGSGFNAVFKDTGNLLIRANELLSPLLTTLGCDPAHSHLMIDLNWVSGCGVLAGHHRGIISWFYLCRLFIKPWYSVTAIFPSCICFSAVPCSFCAIWW